MGDDAGDGLLAARLAELARERDRLAGAVAARDQFLALISHELRTPVQALLLHLEATLRLGQGRDDEGEWTRARIEKAITRVRELGELLDRFLDVTRIQAGKIDLAYEETDLVAVTGEVLRRMGNELVWAGCAVSFQFEEAVVGRWDPTRLDAIVSNLVSNARKYGAGKPIEVRVQKVDHHAVLVVEDHGPGIPADQHERIFDRFERVASGSAPRVPGVGLGLWITRQFVEAHGGRISVANRAQGGAAFTVTLPRGSAA
jgi:signal transduction histidine kinase